MKYHIVTLGCPKNVVDSEGMGSILHHQGHTLVAQAEDADVIIVNTCSFIAAAREETLHELHTLAAQKAPGQRLIAAGCMAESHRDLLRTLPGVDATLSTRQWMDIGALLNDTPPPPAAVSSPSGDWRTSAIQRRSTTASAYLKISDGCTLRCAFCTIPTIKGDMRSKRPEDVLHEAQQLVAQGVYEIVLVAQHLTDYGRDLGMHDGLAALLDHLCAMLPPTVWLRLMYAYPQNITPRLIETMTRHPQICAYLDMPLQHAHPDTLRRMHRPPDTRAIQQVIADVRSALPDVALRSTFIVGFPGETRNEFQTLLRFLETIQFDWVGVFRYSREEQTPAATLPAQVRPREIERRWHQAMQTQQPISQAQNNRWIGRELAVLVEGEGALDDGRPLCIGRSFREAPEVDGQIFIWRSVPVGHILPVRITHATAYDLWGTPVTDSSDG